MEEIVLTTEQTEYYFERLKSHYKIGQRLEFGSGWYGTGNCNYYRILMKGGRCTKDWVAKYSASTLAHEVAHAIDFIKRPQRDVKRHCKKHTRLTERVFKFILSHREAWDLAIKNKAEKGCLLANNRLIKEHQEEAYRKTDAFKIEGLEKKKLELTRVIIRKERALKKVLARLKYYEKKKLSPPL